MRVLYVWDADYPWDVRTEKVCLALVREGHKVVIASRNLQGRPRSEALPEGLIERLPYFGGHAWNWLSFPAFFSPVWIRHLVRLRHAHAIELIVVRDLPLAPTALLAAGKCPVILDMAENYPAMIADIWTDGRQQFLDAIVRNPRLVRAVERFILRRVSHVLTVVAESKDRLLGMNVPADRISIVSNTPPQGRVTSPVARIPGEPIRLVYLGLMEHHRGVAVVLDSAQILTACQVPFHLDLIGNGRDFEQFRAHASHLNLSEKHVEFHGRLSHEQAIAIVERAHVGLVPHSARESWNTTIPNKLFDYMAAGLAVVTSDAVPAARIVRETSAGLVFQSGTPADLAKQIRLLLDIDRWDAHRRAGIEAIRSRYNWEADSRVLLEVVSKVGTDSGLRPPSSETGYA